MNTTQSLLTKAFNGPVKVALLQSIEAAFKGSKLTPSQIEIKSTLLSHEGYHEEIVLKYVSTSCRLETPMFITYVHNEEKSTIISQEDRFLKRIRDHVNDNLLQTDFGIEELAKAMALSTSHLYRKIKRLTGQSTAIYMRSIKLDKGKDLIRNSNLTISEAAYKAGFSDPFYFSRTFSKAYGISPSAYRKSIKEK